MTRTTLMGLLLLPLLAVACHRPPAGKKPKATDTRAVLATVNDVPIRDDDLALEGRKGSKIGAHQGVAAAGANQNVLETVIRKELAAQRAVALGLDADPGYQAELRRMEAELAGWRRQRLSDLLFRSLTHGKSPATEADARRFFDENEKLVRTELQVDQLLLRNEAAITQARAELERGASFEEVHKKYVGAAGAAAAGKPWSLGWLRFNQIPEPWRPFLRTLKEGQLSPVISGIKKRFWVIRLVKSRENPELKFEDQKDFLIQYLQSSAVVLGRQKQDRELRAKARIVYYKH